MHVHVVVCASESVCISEEHIKLDIILLQATHFFYPSLVLLTVSEYVMHCIVPFKLVKSIVKLVGWGWDVVGNAASASIVIMESIALLHFQRNQ